jgi:hypothetical protein
MKKLFLLVAVAGFLTACNSTGSSSEEVTDSVVDAMDSIKDARIDSIQDTTHALIQKVEATDEKTDSANRAAADTAKSK